MLQPQMIGQKLHAIFDMWDLALNILLKTMNKAVNHTLDSWLLLFAQMIAHGGLIWQIIHGSPADWLASGLIYFLTGCFGMTMTYHRLLSHRSWNAPRWFEIVGTILATYGLTGSSLAWVAVHREHHHHTDKVGDPHSPAHHGFFRVQWLSMFERPNPRYAAHLLRDKLHTITHKYYFLIHVGIAAAFLYLEPQLLVPLYLAPAAILWNAGSLINTLTHMIGYRNHQTGDNSTNIWLLGYLMWGEGWHNNHHNRPSTSRFGEKWWEFDIGHAFIKLLERRG